MRKISSQSSLKKRLTLAGISFCLCTTLFLSCVSVGSVGVTLLSRFKPIQSGPYLYLHGPDDAVYALNAYSGTIHHQYNLNYRPDVFNPNFYFGNAINDQGILYYGGYRGIYAARLQDGSLLWKRYLSTVPFGSISPVTVTGGTLFVQSNSMFYAIHASNGALLWQYDLSKDFAAEIPFIINDALIENGVLCFSARIPNRSGYTLLAIDTRNSSFLWKQELDSYPRSSDVADGALYIASDTILHAYRLRDGSLLWEHKGVNIISSVAVSKSFIIVRDARNIYALRTSDHRFVWFYSENDDTNTDKLFVTNDTVYTDTLALQIDSGQLLWRYGNHTFSRNDILINPNDESIGVKNIVYRYRGVSLSSTSKVTYLEAMQHSSGTVVWQQKIDVPNLQDAMISHGIIFLLNYGFICAYAASTGQFLWQQNLRFGSNLGNTYSSFVAVDDS